MESLESRPKCFTGAGGFGPFAGSTGNNRQSLRDSTAYLDCEWDLEGLAEKVEKVSHPGFGRAAAREAAEA